MAKFRKLKKKPFVVISKWGDVGYSYIDGILTEHNEWEYDNGLYVDSGWESETTTWKRLKEYLKDDKKNTIIINKGYCHRCGQKLTSENYKNEIKDSLYPYFEYDFFYCNDCKEKQVQDFENFMNEYKEKDN